MSVTFTPIPQGTDVNLTADGSLDWVHWGLYTESSLNRKAGVTPQIHDFTPRGFTGPFPYADNYNGYSWRDGFPTSSVTNTPTGVWMYGKPNGFELQFLADTTPKTLKIYVGTFGAVGEFTATLSGAPKYTDTSISNTGNGPGGVYTLEVAADTPGDVLDIRFVVDRTFDSTGNVTLQAATLSAAGANNPPAVSIRDPADGANFSVNDPITIMADASDADGSIVKVEFFQDDAKLGESTDSPYSLTWSNAQPGNYLLSAKASDERGATGTSAPLRVIVNGTGGVLSGRGGLPTNSVDGSYRIDLTEEGTVDWAHWGLTSAASFDHKAGVPQISNFTAIGGNNPQRLEDYITEFSWSDGMPTGSTAPTRSGVFIHGSTNGFRITAPADFNSRTLKVYLGLYGAEGKFQAYLSDHSAPAYTDTSFRGLTVYDNAVTNYTLDYRSATSGQMLIVEFTSRTLFDADYGNVSLEAATLSGASLPTNFPPAVAIMSPTNGATYTAPADITITAEASDRDGTVSLVEFFQADTQLGAVTDSTYVFSWTNVDAGSYTLTAKATDAGGANATSIPVNITVNRTPAVPVTLHSLVASSNSFSFSFSTESNRTYTVESTITLSPVDWQTLTNLVGDGSVVTATDSIQAEAQHYYRVKAQ